MAIDRDPGLHGQDSITGNAKVYDATTTDTAPSRSNFLPFLLGGLVIALGLLGFLFYDGGGTNRDVSTTGSTTTQSAPATTNTTAAPATTAPAAPTTPAPRQ
jgi:hypothetical protein